MDVETSPWVIVLINLATLAVKIAIPAALLVGAWLVFRTFLRRH